jgi:stage V sporulation protein R
VSAIHDEAGYRILREAMSRQYDLGSREPNIQVWSVNLRGDRSLVLRHTQHNERPLDDHAEEVLKHVARLWGFPVHLESVDSHGKRSRHWLVGIARWARSMLREFPPLTPDPFHGPEGEGGSSVAYATFT